MIKGVIFDFDGVLVDSHGIINRLFTKIANDKLGINITEVEFAEHPGLRFEHKIEMYAKSKKLDITREQIEKAVLAGREEYYKNWVSYVMPYPGIPELLENLKKAGIGIGLGTNGNRKSVEKILNKMGLLKYFSSIVTFEDVDIGKPAPNIFLKNSEQLRLKPGECVVIEDSVEGVEAAKAAGMKVIALTTSTTPALLEDADRIVKTIKDLKAEDILHFDD